MQQTVSGFKFEGRWKDVVNKGEELTEAMKDADAEESAFSDWDEWRPREEESYAAEVKQKTVEKASVKQNRVESKGKTARAEAEDAVQDVGSAMTEATRGEVDEASKHTREAVGAFLLSMDTAVRKSVRTVEHVIYKHIVARANPYYFDGQLVSASLNKKRSLRSEKGNTYQLAVTINDDEVFDHLKDEITG